MNLAGPVFFAAAGELQFLLDRFLDDGRLRVLILRLRQADAFDVTTASVLEEIGVRMTEAGKTLLLLGVRPATLQLLEQSGVAEWLGRANLFPTQTGWFTAMELALRRALALTEAHHCGEQCPLAEYVAAQEVLRATAETR
jgi:MFS superfamily sulfate permease-like transporter